jgi:tRNA(Ile)-lysidine synthase
MVSCFSDRYFQRIIANNLIISKKWLIGVSGGSDSLALALIIREYLNLIGAEIELYLATVNHNLRKEADREIDFLRNFANFYGFELFVSSWKHDGFFDGNIYAEARKNRYRILFEQCKEIDSKVLLTAHHLDDQIETFKMRVSRGSGVPGLSCINHEVLISGVNLIRPLINISKNDLKRYLSEKSVLWVEDRANYDVQKERSCLRSVRSNEEFPNINLMTSKFKIADEALNFYCEQEFDKIVRVGDFKILFSIEGFLSIPTEIGIRILRKILIEYFFVEERRILFNDLMDLYKEICNKKFFNKHYLGLIINSDGENIVFSEIS